VEELEKLMSVVTPNGPEIKRLGTKAGCASTASLLSTLNVLSMLAKELKTHEITAFRLSADGASRPVTVSEGTIANMERGKSCRLDSLLSVAHALVRHQA
jgi:hypothetical protein